METTGVAAGSVTGSTADSAAGSAVRIEPWSESDLALLRAANAPELMTELGGPETEEKLLSRHRRYVDLTADPAGKGRMYAIVLTATGERVGTIGFWEQTATSDGLAVYETGWAVLAAFQGRGLATAATRLVIEEARARGGHRYLLAYPKVTNGASNAVCRKLGFELRGEVGFEYPPGNPIRSHEWRFDLRPADGPSGV
ncbi:GNAT family N-acetyltransferase [Streptomyces qinzhouensis]|uniref:GNAT family N-acetyltransferase n=1 Tax=Streptomyces qinzhouensis TaxID=2599401 RepID=A0A5B8JAL6_9ACTN|nr:GNAT family N-acetyltransferase [Streptomyces qinzhouensis]QDY78396.1 GNAT family N-acetyltransferase [Streptomyces qinzhouensis]